MRDHAISFATSGLRRRPRALGLATAALAAFGPLVPCRAEPDAKAGPIAEIAVKRASRECFTSLVHASGYLVPRATAVVMFVAPGYRVTEVKAKVGDHVERGDVVARVGAVAPPEKNAPSDVPLKAGAAGTVLQVDAFVGMPISEKSKPLVTIAVGGEIEASVSIPSVHVPELKAGQPARLTIRDGGTLEARVRRVPALVDIASQMGTARLSLTRGGRLELSRFVLATIEARRSCGVGVPMTALRRTSAGNYVDVVVDGVITGRAVSLGLANATDSEVTSGLAEGDLVVAGAGSSREGDHVKPILADAQDGP